MSGQKSGARPEKPHEIMERLVDAERDIERLNAEVEALKAAVERLTKSAKT
jgi:hypothetical protein